MGDVTEISTAISSILYLRRWEMELSFHHLKTPLQMEHLSCLKPHTVQRELWMPLMGHNLVRRLIQQSARHFFVSLPRLSFAGALAGARRTAEAPLQARTQRQRREICDQLLHTIAEDAASERPGRQEPRAVKHRPQPYPLLTRHRPQPNALRLHSTPGKSSP
ncbi:MAG: transposase [Verrucomicrobiae bacterium]|nr:transposase [Verrucomicrobiae bacterium]